MNNREAHFYLEELQRMMTTHRGIFSEEFVCANGMAILALEQEQKEGHWKPRKHYVSPLHEAFVEDYECSNCHFQLGELEWNYCPICGTRMKEERLRV